MKQFSLLEIISTCSAASYIVVDLLESSMLLTQATLQATHRCTHAPYGMLAVLPTLPGLTLESFRKHTPNSVATAKARLKQT